MSLLASPLPKPRRKSSNSISLAPEVSEITYDRSSRRRSSFITSFALDDDADDEDDLTTHGGYRRKSPWNSKREQRVRESVKSVSSRSPVSHHECKIQNSIIAQTSHSSHSPSKFFSLLHFPLFKTNSVNIYRTIGSRSRKLLLCSLLVSVNMSGSLTFAFTIISQFFS